MRRVEAGAKQDAEIAAAAFPQRVQEQPITRLVPVTCDVDALPVGQPETKQIDGPGTRMRAEWRLLAMVDIAVGVAAHMLDKKQRRTYAPS